MNVIIRSQRAHVSQALEAHARERMVRAIQPFAGQIERVDLPAVARRDPSFEQRHVA